MLASSIFLFQPDVVDPRIRMLMRCSHCIPQHSRLPMNLIPSSLSPPVHIIDHPVWPPIASATHISSVLLADVNSQSIISIAIITIFLLARLSVTISLDYCFSLSSLLFISPYLLSRILPLCFLPSFLAYSQPARPLLVPHRPASVLLSAARRRCSCTPTAPRSLAPPSMPAQTVSPPESITVSFLILFPG